MSDNDKILTSSFFFPSLWNIISGGAIDRSVYSYNIFTHHQKDLVSLEASASEDLPPQLSTQDIEEWNRSKLWESVILLNKSSVNTF